MSVGPLPAPELPLVGGLVAHNEERALAAAVDSLRAQRLPPGARWDRIWIVASGCTDGTVGVAHRLAREDPRIAVIVETERRGKAAALDLVLERAVGSPLVLLNADARAAPGAVAALIAAAGNRPAPFAVMGRPVPDLSADDPVGRLVAMLWSLHHEFHVTSLAGGRGNHLSDELLLLRAPGLPAIPEGVINDGSYVGAWLAAHGGSRLYAPDARVVIQVPESLGDHLKQRRRILVGHAQIRRLLGERPDTLPGLALRSPRAAAQVVLRGIRNEPRRALDLAALALPELLATVLSVWDRIPPRRDHVRWDRIRPPVGYARGTPR